MASSGELRRTLSAFRLASQGEALQSLLADEQSSSLHAHPITYEHLRCSRDAKVWTKQSFVLNNFVLTEPRTAISAGPRTNYRCLLTKRFSQNLKSDRPSYEHLKFSFRHNLKYDLAYSSDSARCVPDKRQDLWFCRPKLETADAMN